MSNQIETKTYYGEYSLAHWIKLIKSCNIKMPEFQRKFTWTERQMRELHNSFKGNFFIPPVIIVRRNGQNLVLDGQQRLTSIVLLSKGMRQKKDNIQYEGKTLWDSWENLSLEGEDSLYESSSIAKMEQNELKTKFLGFSFILVNEKGDEANKYFAKIFHSVNSSGINLTYEEKLHALKSIAINFEELIYSDKLEKYKVNNKKIDLIRYLAFSYIFNDKVREEKLVSLLREQDLSNGDQISTSLLEKIYYDFIKSLSFDEDEIELFKGVKERLRRISKEELKTKLEELVKFLDSIGLDEDIDNIYLSDLYLFGLVSYLFVKEKSVKDVEINNIKDDFSQKIDKIKKKKVKNTNLEKIYTNKPNTFNYIKARVEASIELYKSVGFNFD